MVAREEEGEEDFKEAWVLRRESRRFKSKRSTLVISSRMLLEFCINNKGCEQATDLEVGNPYIPHHNKTRTY